MKKHLLLLTMTITLAATAEAQTAPNEFAYTNERFADIQMLRYKVEGFENLTLRQKTFIYYLQEAALWGRDIAIDQNGRHNLRIMQALESVYVHQKALGDTSADWKAFEEYTKRVWFSSGIHHHYGSEKFQPAFSQQWFEKSLRALTLDEQQALNDGKGVESFIQEVCPVIFDAQIQAVRTNQRDGEDLVQTSAVNFYEPGITQREAEEFYAQRKPANDPRPVMMGLNSRLERSPYGGLRENVYRVGGLYGATIERICFYLEKARPFADRPEQQEVIDRLLEFYRTGDLRTFDEYSIAWLNDTKSLVDFTNGFIETYDDPLGMKASWEAIVNYKDLAATQRTEKLSQNAQWFEDHSPVDARFKKPECKGISAKVITAAILAGRLYPSTAIGINLPNSDWVRREHGSKSVTIANLTDAYNKAAHGSGMDKEFVIDEATREIIKKYGDVCDDLHTDLHECLGHGSGRLLPGTDPDTLGVYGSTIEEARADLFGLYYVADEKLVELGLTPNMDAYKSQYYTYMQNGLLTQLVRIKPGAQIEEAHMRNRALIAQWVLEKGAAKKVVELIKRKGKTYVRINDYEALRGLFGELLAEVQRIKSEGDFAAARALVEGYGVKVDAKLHEEVLRRYAALNLSPYKGFINPVYEPEYDAAGQISDVKVSYTEAYDEQMLRYSRCYRIR